VCVWCVSVVYVYMCVCLWCVYVSVCLHSVSVHVSPIMSLLMLIYALQTDFTFLT